MIRHLLLPATLLLAACPTPQDATERAADQPGSPGPAEPGPQADPSTGEDAAAGDAAAGDAAAGDAAAGDAAGGAPPASQGSASAFMKFDMEVPVEGPAEKTQQAVAAGSHVTLSGTVLCTDCSEALVLRATRFVLPGNDVAEPPPIETGTLPGPLTSKVVPGVGDFSLVVPKGEVAITLDLLVDSDGDGVPSKGDRMSSLRATVDGQELVPNKDYSGLTIDGTDREWTPPRGGPGAGEDVPMPGGPGPGAVDKPAATEGTAPAAGG